jgi:hypothetical protein
MKKTRILLVSILILLEINAFCQDGIPVSISVGFLTPDPPAGEFIHIKITDTKSNVIKYENQVTLSVPDGFFNTVYLMPGIYKCEIPDMGVFVKMPEIRINGGSIIPWGYPDYEYFQIIITDQITKIEINGFSNTSLIFPNPFTDFLNINSVANIEKIEIFNTNGRKMKTFQNKKQKDVRIDLISLSSGIYILKARINGVENKYKIIKE